MNEMTKKLYRCFEDMGVLSTALHDSAHLTRDLGLDSLDVTDLILRIESTFNIEISDAEINSFQTIQDINTHLHQKIMVQQ
ncbi:acyl carrier protein [Emticicia sp. TH156]|uniref:acyl carrier protein n=1 Tax=Emticicia sp. TH156 TaxID=2067454 RepID=UPI001C1F2511|nr:acyl carrier protein [Emticicia sp. TH156]